MNKKTIFGVIGAVSLIGGIVGIIINRSNKRYRRAISEVEYATDVLETTADLLEHTVDYLIEKDGLMEKFYDEEDDDYNE